MRNTPQNKTQNKKTPVRLKAANYQADADRPFNRLLNERDARENKTVRAANAATPAKKTGTQQIMELLKEFNVRLKRDELERERLWKEMESLQTLIDRQTQKTSAADPQIEKWKRVMEDNQRALHTQISQTKGLQTELEDRIENVETTSGSMALRFDDVLSEQKRLTRRVDTAVEDKSRLLTKMANLEDALTQTQDTLRAKALVLLTDQATAGKTSLPKTPAYEEPFRPSFDRKPEAPRAHDPLFRDDVKRTATPLRQPQSQNQTHGQSQVHPLKAERMNTSRLGVYAVAASFAAILAVGTVIVLQQNKYPDLPELNISKSAQKVAGTFEPIDMASIASDMNALEPGSLGDTPVLTEAPVTKEAQIDRPVAIKTSVSDDVLAEQQQAQTLLKNSVKRGDLSVVIGVDSSLPSVVKTIESQALGGDAAAQHDLAAIYSAGHGGVKTNFEKASEWFEQAAYNGVANARYNLGVLYHQGLGVQKDEGYAIELYKTAALLNHPEAEYNLGIAYIEGIGVPQNVAKAAHYFEAAATNDVMEAAYNLGLIYENGLLGKQQPDEALFWYKVASSKGSLQGRQALESLADQLELNPSDVDALISRIAVLKPNVKLVLGTRAITTAEEPVTTEIVYREEPKAQDKPMELFPEDTYNHKAGSDAVIVAQIQDQLIGLGMYPGPADGISGPVTSDAVRAYQDVNGLQKDGVASEDLLVHMLAREFELNTYPASGVFQDVGSQE